MANVRKFINGYHRGRGIFHCDCRRIIMLEYIPTSSSFNLWGDFVTCRQGPSFQIALLFLGGPTSHFSFSPTYCWSHVHVFARSSSFFRQKPVTKPYTHWIGLRNNLQETPIFNDKNHGFRFPWNQSNDTHQHFSYHSYHQVFPPLFNYSYGKPWFPWWIGIIQTMVSLHIRWSQSHQVISGLPQLGGQRTARSEVPWREHSGALKWTLCWGVIQHYSTMISDFWILKIYNRNFGK